MRITALAQHRRQRASTGLLPSCAVLAACCAARRDGHPPLLPSLLLLAPIKVP